jgi:hypothetical protein
MTQENEALKTLTAARDRLIDERRALAVAIALGYKRRRSDDSQTDNMRVAFVSIQNTIEAIDRAIGHEKFIASEQAEAYLVPTIEANSADASRFDNRQ